MVAIQKLYRDQGKLEMRLLGCDRANQAMTRQPGVLHSACDTALGRLRHGAGAPVTRRWGACDTAINACDTAGGHGQDMAAAPTTRPCAREPGRAYAHLGVLAESAGCAHCALVQFFDLVLFLSHYLDTVHEHCSSQNFF